MKITQDRAIFIYNCLKGNSQGLRDKYMILKRESNSLSGQDGRLARDNCFLIYECKSFPENPGVSVDLHYARADVEKSHRLLVANRKKDDVLLKKCVAIEKDCALIKRNGCYVNWGNRIVQQRDLINILKELITLREERIDMQKKSINLWKESLNIWEERKELILAQ